MVWRTYTNAVEIMNNALIKYNYAKAEYLDKSLECLNEDIITIYMLNRYHKNGDILSRWHQSYKDRTLADEKCIELNHNGYREGVWEVVPWELVLKC